MEFSVSGVLKTAEPRFTQSAERRPLRTYGRLQNLILNIISKGL
jgi:hypothetical protein